MSDAATDEEEPETAGEQAESGDKPEGERPEEQAEAGTNDEQPVIEDGEQASIPEGIDPQEIEEQTTEEEAEAAEEESSESEGESTGMEPDAPSGPVKAGEIYVTLVQQTTNAAIRAKGKEGAEEVDRDHFEEYELAHYFDLTMEDMGIGSDLEPHEALMLSTAMAMGEPILKETEVLDQQISRMMDKAMGAGA